MGEARRKRLALINGGNAEEAKKPEYNQPPQNVVQITVLVRKSLADLIDKRYDEDVNQAVVTSRNAWIERLIVAGLASFDEEKRKQAEQASLVKLAGPQDVAKAATQIAGEGRVTLR
jgi:hypothetical protein